MKRPETCDEGVEQLRLAMADAPPVESHTTPRALLWRACAALVGETEPARAFVDDGLRVLYDANMIVSFMLNSLVPHVVDRLRYDTLNEEHDHASRKPDSVEQNRARFRAIRGELEKADGVSRAKKVDATFAKMRQAVAPLYADECVVAGLDALYVSNKKARRALDLILERLTDALNKDTTVVKTTEIPFDVMMFGG